MENYYRLLGINPDASFNDIKKAFREKAKHLHPDIAGSTASAEMCKLLVAYEVLSDKDRRYEYDRTFVRLIRKKDFDYRTFLEEHTDDPECQAKLMLFELFHNHEEAALTIWRQRGGLDFSVKQYLERGEWMDGIYILAEELEKRQCYYEAFVLLADLLREERQLPYFRHFTLDIELFLKELVRRRLKPTVDERTWVFCMETLLGLGFSAKDEARWMRSMAESLYVLGEIPKAKEVFYKALTRDPQLARVKRLQKQLML
jgi:curved DNA-binding protein CbpA